MLFHLFHAKSLGSLVFLFTFLCFSPGCNSPSEKIYAPTVTGTPPSNAFIGLVRLENGEIRHYNYGSGNKEGRAFYIRSHDNGQTWDTVQVDGPGVGADVKSPVSGEYIRLATTERGVECIRSNGGIDGEWTRSLVYRAGDDEGSYIMLKPPVFIREGRRILVGAHSTERFGCGVFYSDDDGLTWKRSQFVQAPHHEPGGFHKSFRWNHGAVEPTVVELNDGTIWMIARTARDHHYESFSEDGGETWSPMQPSRFFGTITMPTMKRLRDGRLLFIWNNSTPLPEIAGNDGVWEDVFTNRDVLHAAISDDDGKTWKGFRELFLNPRRNDPDYAESDQSLSLDMSVHQNQFVELDDGNVLVSLGQHRLHRKLLLFNPNWLLETGREDDFSSGLHHWSTFLYQKGVVGHCAYNRSTGARLVDDPFASGEKVLKVARGIGENLEIANQGAVWNFPALQKGTFETEVFVPEKSKGGLLNLTDRWFNPCDTTARHFAMYSLSLDRLQRGKWNYLKFRWNLNAENPFCEVTNRQAEFIAQLELNEPSENGISYVHFISTAKQPDPNGFFVKYVKSTNE